MAYTICDSVGNPKPIRLIWQVGDIGNPEAEIALKLGTEVQPYWWTCDPCNPAAKRYAIEFRPDEPQYHRWFEVITSDDDEKDIAIKMEHYRKVILSDRALQAARREWERLNG